MTGSLLPKQSLRSSCDALKPRNNRLIKDITFAIISQKSRELNWISHNPGLLLCSAHLGSVNLDNERVSIKACLFVLSGILLLKLFICFTLHCLLF